MRGIKVGLCMGALIFCLYGYLSLQNEITKKRLEIPLLSKEIREIKEKNTCLRYQIDLFESPENLMTFVGKKEYAHLKQPWLKDVLAVREGSSIEPDKSQLSLHKVSSLHSVVVGTNH
ncbi:MAG: hypothetical protein RLZZ453_1048 [Chlamydiota bacterium]|jgi:hypothetical protein